MVFRKKRAEPDTADIPPAPQYQKTATINAPTQQGAALPQTQRPPQPPPTPQLPDDLQRAIQHFNATYAGTFPDSELSQLKDLLFAVYAELRAIREER